MSTKEEAQATAKAGLPSPVVLPTPTGNKEREPLAWQAVTAVMPHAQVAAGVLSTASLMLHSEQLCLWQTTGTQSRAQKCAWPATWTAGLCLESTVITICELMSTQHSRKHHAVQTNNLPHPSYRTRAAAGLSPHNQTRKQLSKQQPNPAQPTIVNHTHYLCGVMGRARRHSEAEIVGTV